MGQTGPPGDPGPMGIPGVPTIILWRNSREDWLTFTVSREPHAHPGYQLCAPRGWEEGFRMRTGIPIRFLFFFFSI